MKTIESSDEVPQIATEDEEAAFWATHDLDRRLLDRMQPIPADGDGVLPPARAAVPLSRTHAVLVRLDEDVLARLRVLAMRKRKGFQALLQESIVERVYEEEKREGIV
jgi:hypothetical protein